MYEYCFLFSLFQTKYKSLQFLTCGRNFFVATALEENERMQIGLLLLLLFHF